MKFSSSPVKSVIILVITLMSLLACHRRFHAEGGDDGVSVSHAAEIILITASDPANDSLILKDDQGNNASTFKVAPGRKIKWILLAKETIEKISSIEKKPSSEDVFSTKPTENGGSLNWEGKIAVSAKDKEESYNIVWIDKSGKAHTYDPKIQVR